MELMSSVRYDAHIHSDFSDGRPTVKDIVDRAVGLRLDTIAIIDHFWPSISSRKGGLRNIRRRRHEIEGARARHDNIRVLEGAEVDIRHDGDLAEVAGGLEQFDIVIGSVHWSSNPDRWARSVTRAAERKQFHILGHYDGYLSSFDSKSAKEVAESLARSNIAVELSDRYPPVYTEFLEMARDAGCFFSLGSDAHKLDEIGNITEALATARALSLPLLRV